MDKNNGQPSPFSDIQSPSQDSPVSTDKAFSENVGSPSVADQPSTGVASPPDNQPLANQPVAAAPKSSEHKSKAPIGAIILAVIVAGALAAITIFAYRQTDKPAPDTNTATETTENTVNGSDVDTAITEAEQSINELNEAEDFPEGELSDSTLGL